MSSLFTVAYLFLSHTDALACVRPVGCCVGCLQLFMKHYKKMYLI